MDWRDVSVILPTIEEKGAFITIDKIKNLMPGCEIIVVDKSSDEYRKKIRAKKVKLIEQKSKGYENALMEGFASAKGSILATIDPDGTYYTEDLVKVINLIKIDDADFAIGNRMKFSEKDAMNGYLKFGNLNITKIYNIFYKIGIHDVLCGIFAMKRRVFESIKNVEPYRAGTLFFILEATKAGYKKIKEVEIKYSKRPEGTESKLAKSKFIYGLGVAIYTIRSARDYSPLLIFGGIGSLLIIAGIIIGALVIANFLHTGSFNEFGRALIAFMLVIIGFFSIIAGLILDLLLQIAKKIDKL
ncbi:MAG: glycosyltransferase family 2 protein [Candidatus Micrarchaeia archaeon]